MRPFDDKYAKLALSFRAKISKKVDRFQIAPTMWKLADYLEEQDADKNKHEQHLLMLGSKWLKQLPSQ